MDKDMEDFIEDYYAEEVEIDEEYEFEASRYFDFTRPEFDYEIEEAEHWFEIFGNYPPSPFFVKLNMEKLLSVEVVPNSSNGKGENYHMVQDAGKFTKKANKLFQTRSSTLMKPTVSHLAKQNKVHDMDSTSLRLRFSKASQSSTGSDYLAIKRQKLEIGYLKKISHLKDQISFLHKSSKKVTVPRGPELETLLRAERRRSKNISTPNDNEKQIGSNFKAHPLNKNAFHLKTMERATLPTIKVSKENDANKSLSSVSINSKRQNTRDTTKTKKQEVKPNSKACHRSQKEAKLSTLTILEGPPIEQLKKLSLGSNNNNNIVSKSETPASIKRCTTKLNPCGGHLRGHEATRRPNTTRSYTSAKDDKKRGHSIRSMQL